jgi:hypothetical protein
MNTDVFLSILAMDSYNRGYNPGVLGLSDANGTQLGTATIQSHSSDEPTSIEFEAGFYALAYNWNGQTVISFRGTDPSTAQQAIADLANGWSNYGARAITLPVCLTPKR